MFSRFGLRFRMAASYVVVSAVAVLIVESILLTIFVPRIQSAHDSVLAAQERAAQAEATQAQAKAEAIALGIASTAGTAASAAAATRPGMSDRALLIDAAKHGFMSGSEAARNGRADAAAGGSRDSSELARALTTVDGRVVSEVGLSSPDLPPKAMDVRARSGLKTVGGRVVAWAAQPVTIADSSAAGTRVIGLAYEELLAPNPGTSATQDSRDVQQGKQPNTQGVGSLLAPGALILVLLVPVGALFGLFSTGRLIQRIRRLALGTKAMAQGDLRSRIPVSGGDEVGELEQAFNSMAEQVEHAVKVELDAAGSAARRTERTRIARELHDSISQDLFSASLVAGGLRKALPAGSKLQRQAESMELTLERTRREMRAMLMELRPVALEDAGLAAALEEMCRAYETRLGIPIIARIDVSNLLPAVEHAVLRVVQEALGNAVRHGDPKTIDVDVTGEGERVIVLIRDDGTGFDVNQIAARHGMGLVLMRERVEELGGTVQVESALQQGTTVRVTM